MKATINKQVKAKPEYKKGELIKSDKCIYLVTGPGKIVETFAGVVISSNASWNKIG